MILNITKQQTIMTRKKHTWSELDFKKKSANKSIVNIYAT